MVIAYGNGTFNKKKKRKEKKRKENEEQAPMRYYRKALVANIKAIGKFYLCSLTLQVFKWWAYFCSKTKMCKNTSIPNRNFLHYIEGLDGGGGGGTNVSCQLKFGLFVSCLLNFWPFVSCQLIGC